MRQFRKRMRQKCPRIHKIISKTAEMAVWTPVFVAVYVQAMLLTYSYYKTDNKRDSKRAA